MQQLSKAADKCTQLEKQLQILKSSSSTSGGGAVNPIAPAALATAAATVTLSSAQLQELDNLKSEFQSLQGVLKKKDQELQESRSQILELQARQDSDVVKSTTLVAEGATAGTMVNTQEVAELKAAHDKRVKDLMLDLEDKEALFEHVQTQNVELSEQVEKLIAELAASKDAVAVTAAAPPSPHPPPAAPTIDTAAMQAKLLSIHKEIKALHGVRESILGELVSMKNDIFNEKTLQQMARMVRDKEIALLRKTKSESRAEVEIMTSQLSELKDVLAEVQRRSEEALKIKDIESQAMINHYMDKWRSEFDKRKKLHNLVAELKGNIRVLCRVRPFIEKEAKEEGAPDPIKCLTEETLRVISVDAKADRDFEFDRVFAPSDGQSKIFEEVSSLVTSVLDGYNVSIMAYGQVRVNLALRGRG
jgi:hypothetical protein